MGSNIRNWQPLGDNDQNLLYSTEEQQRHLALMVRRDLIEDWDFIGFKYNGYHSITDLHIYRISDGSRYNDTLNPNMTDKTVDIPGRDGMYFFNTKYTQKQFTINFAFDRLTESDLRKIRNVFSGKEIHELVFDELPYKVWAAKVTGTSTVKYLCFDSYDGSSTGFSSEVSTNVLSRGLPEYEYGSDDNYKTRLYRGEGSIQFTCYYPYAHTPTGKKTKEDFLDYGNYNQWIESSTLPDQVDADLTHTGYHKIVDDTHYYYNYGDIPAYFKVKYNGSPLTGDPITIKVGNNQIVVPLNQSITNFEWDSRTGLVRSMDGVIMKPIQFSGNSIGTIPVTISDDSGVEVDLPSGFELDYDFWYL